MFLRLLKILGRMIVGFLLGSFLASIIGLIGLGLLARSFGGLEEALNKARDHDSLQVIVPVWLAGMIGVWVASILSAVLMRRTSLKRPFLTSCGASAVLSLFANIVFVASFVWIYREQYPYDVNGMQTGVVIICCVVSLISAACVNNDLNRVYGIRKPSE